MSHILTETLHRCHWNRTFYWARIFSTDWRTSGCFTWLCFRRSNCLCRPIRPWRSHCPSTRHWIVRPPCRVPGRSCSGICCGLEHSLRKLAFDSSGDIGHLCVVPILDRHQFVAFHRHLHHLDLCGWNCFCWYLWRGRVLLCPAQDLTGCRTHHSRSLH